MMTSKRPERRGTKSNTAPGKPACRGVAVDGEALRHDVYDLLIDLLGLSDEHRKNLERRGMTERAIAEGRYKTLPKSIQKIVRVLTDKYGWDTLRTVPGFYTDQDGNETFETYRRGGLMIPARGVDGRFLYLKLRIDEEGRKPRADGEMPPKYLPITSPGGRGAAAKMAASLPPGFPVRCDRVWVTEGELKAHIAFCRGGIPTLSVPGVTAWRMATPVLRQLAATDVVLAYDADAATNANVARPLAAAFDGLRLDGFDVSIAVWPAESGKGLDDLVVGSGLPDVLRGEAAEKWIRELVETLGVQRPTIAKAGRAPSRGARHRRKASSGDRAAFDVARRAVDLAGVLTRDLGAPVRGLWLSPWTGKHHIRLCQRTDGAPGWICRKTAECGDAIDWLRIYHRLSFKEACERLGLPMPGSPQAEYAPSAAASENLGEVFNIDGATPEALPSTEPAASAPVKIDLAEFEHARDDSRRCPTSSRQGKRERELPRQTRTIPRCPKAPVLGVQNIDNPSGALLIDARCRQRDCPFCGPKWVDLKVERFIGHAERHDGPFFVAVIDLTEWQATRKRIRRAINDAPPGEGRSNHGYAQAVFESQWGSRLRALVVTTVIPAAKHRRVSRDQAERLWRLAVARSTRELKKPVTFSDEWEDRKRDPTFRRVGATRDIDNGKPLAEYWGLGATEFEIGNGARRTRVLGLDGFSSDPEESYREIADFLEEIPEVGDPLLWLYHDDRQARRVGRKGLRIEPKRPGPGHVIYYPEGDAD